MAITIGLLWAVLAAVAVNMLLGMLWYGTLFAKPWIKAMGWGDLRPEELKAKQQSAGPGYAISMATSAVATVMLWFLFDWAQGTPDAYAPWLKGLVIGFTGFVAFYIPGTLTGAFFHEQRFSLWAISAGYWGILAMAWGVFVGLFY